VELGGTNSSRPGSLQQPARRGSIGGDRRSDYVFPVSAGHHPLVYLVERAGSFRGNIPAITRRIGPVEQLRDVREVGDRADGRFSISASGCVRQRRDLGCR